MTLPRKSPEIVAKLLRVWRQRKRVRPVAPTPQRQLLVTVLAALVIVGLDLFSAYVYFIPNLGLPYFFLTIAAAIWGGILPALATSAFLTLHVWLVYEYKIPPYGLTTLYASKQAIDHAREIRGTAITFPLWAVIVGGIQIRLRHAGVREYDARQSALLEAEGRQAAETGLRSSEEMRRLIVDSATDAIVVLGREGEITHWNPHAQELFGWAPNEVLGRRLFDTALPTRLTGPHLRQGLERAGSAVRDVRLETQAMTKGGDEIDVEVSIVSPKGEGDPVSILFFRDIRDRKRAEEAILGLNAELERRVVERTSQLEEANAELVGFNYSVSHDLRTPLRGIVSNSRILVEDASDRLDEESVDRLKRVEAAALKMADLIESLLQFARMGQVEPIRESVDLSALGESVAHELPGDGKVTVQPGMMACGDASMLGLVVLNLLDNAWKYVRPGIAPEVEFGQREDGAFYVRDRGIGFDMQYVDKVWQPFERLHRDGEYSGTGIGLANCKRIVERHGGRMWAESAPDEGTTVFFTLPHVVPLPLA